MISEQKNCLVAQSGGPTAAINASLTGVLRAAFTCGRFDTVYGARNGIQGLLQEKLLNLKELFFDNPFLLQQLMVTPSMFLGSCRYKLPKPTDPSAKDIYSRIFQILQTQSIAAFFYIGGNDSMDTIKKLSEYGAFIGSPIRFIGIPKTIDNDLPVTDHTPGYGSAAKYIATSILEMAHDTYIYNTKSVLIAEIMGRDAGWLTASSALARTSYSPAPQLIYLPEVSFDEDRFLSDVKTLLEKQKHVILAVSEGIRHADGSYVSANSSTVDEFGHSMLSGAGKYLEHLVSKSFGCKVRSVEINILQRCAAHLASKTDLEESAALGEEAVKLALSGETGKMVIIKRESKNPYQISYSHVDISLVANQIKNFPMEWITKSGNHITEEFLSYARPFIQGTPQITYENGLPVYLSVEHLNDSV